MSAILITGGVGFIGSSLARRLHNEGHQVTILDNLSPQIHGTDPRETSPSYKSIEHIPTFIKADIRDRIALEKSLKNIDVVVHLAAETGTGQSMYAISNYCDVNIQGTAILLEEIAKHKDQIKKIIVASSRAIYGEGQYYCQKHGNIFPSSRDETLLKLNKFEHQCPQCHAPLKLSATEEEAPAKPRSIYGITKLTQEELVLNTAQAWQIPAFALRFQNVYGPGQSLSNPYTGILSIFSSRARAHKSISIFEDGLESRDFVYIDDIVQALHSAIFSTQAGQNAINIGTGKPTTVNEVVTQITSFFNSKSEVKITGESRIGDIRHNFADLKKAKSILNFEPTIFFNEGITKFLNWASEQTKITDNYEKSLQELKQRGLLK